MEMRRTYLVGITILALLAGGCSESAGNGPSEESASQSESKPAESQRSRKNSGGSDATAVVPGGRVEPQAQGASQVQQAKAAGGQTRSANVPQPARKPAANAFPALPTQDTLNRRLRQQGRRLVASSSATADASLLSLSQKLAASCVIMDHLLTGRPEERGVLIAGLESFNAGQDTEAIGLFAGLAASGLAAEQSKVAAEVRDLAGALAVQRTFPGSHGGDEGPTVVRNCLLSHRTGAAVMAARELAQDPALTAAQRAWLSQLAVLLTPAP